MREGYFVSVGGDCFGVIVFILRDVDCGRILRTSVRQEMQTFILFQDG